VEHALGQLGTPLPTEALEHSLQRPEAPLTRILVRDPGKSVPLAVEAIEYLRSDTKYTAIASRGRQFLVRLPINSFEQRLDPARFLKLQRSCIVNLDFVESMTPDESSQLVVQMQDGMRFTASREVSKRLREQAI
jgi:two-component system LytT family response regulator